MSVKKQSMGTDFGKLDAHIIQPHEYDELPDLTDEALENAAWSIGDKPVSVDEGVAAFVAGLRPGRPKSKNPKLAVNIRLSPDVLTAFRESGPGWQTRIDEALREWLKKRRT
jgi:uncharacterized protein (DUF4415 family)